MQSKIGVYIASLLFGCFVFLWGDNVFGYSVTIKSNPTGATVYFVNNSKGITTSSGLYLTGLSGNYQMSLKKSGFTDYEYTLSSGDSGKTLTFNLDPMPDLISVSGIPSSATIGSPFTITISAKNKGNVSDEGSIHAALRFSDWGGQSLSERRDDLDVAIVANTWATGYLNWRPNDNKTCYEKNGGTHSPIRENFIEAYDAPWPATTEQQATFTVTPRRTGTLYVLVRTTMQKADDTWANDISADTSKPSDLDEQGWTCRRYEIPVGEVQGQIYLDIRDADRNQLQSDVNAVQLWGNNGLIKRWDPPNSNPIQAGSYTYGDYYADVYAWDMWICQKHFTLGSSYQNVECQASIRKRPLEITALYGSGPVPGATIYLDSWNGEYNTWSENKAYGTSGSDGKVTFSAWPTVPASQSYRVRVYYQGVKVGEASDIKVDANNGGSSVVQCSVNQSSPGTLQFAEADRAKTVEEAIGPLSFYVVRQNGVDGSAAVHYEIGGGTAVPGTDYSATQYSGDLTWNNGDGDVKPITVTILNPDSQINDARTFNITLSQTSGQGGTLGAFRTAAVTITDDDKPLSGVIHFDANSYNDQIVENVIFAQCRIQRSNGTDGRVQVKWSTKQLQGNDAAVEGQDYKKSEGTLIWEDGYSADQTFIISVLNSEWDELSARQFAVELTADTADTELGSPSNATIYIVNRKSQLGGVIEFDKSAYLANDSDGQVQINVLRRNANASASIKVATRDDTAISGTDYAGGTESINWNSSDIVYSFSIRIADVSQNKGFWVELSDPSINAVLGSVPKAYVTILDTSTAKGGSVSNISASPAYIELDADKKTIITADIVNPSSDSGDYELSIFVRPTGSSGAEDVRTDRQAVTVSGGASGSLSFEWWPSSDTQPGFYDIATVLSRKNNANSYVICESKTFANCVNIVPVSNRNKIDAFSFDNIPDVQKGTVFSVTIQAVKDGETVSSFNGVVNLRLNDSRIIDAVTGKQINKVLFVDGVSTRQFKIDDPGVNRMLMADYQGITGESELFDVLGQTVQNGKIVFYDDVRAGIKPSDRFDYSVYNLPAGATVSVVLDGSRQTSFTFNYAQDVVDHLLFGDVAPGIHTIAASATHNGDSYTAITQDPILITPGGTHQLHLEFGHIVPDNDANYPILLVPGVLASTTTSDGNGYFTSVLPENKAMMSDLKISARLMLFARLRAHLLHENIGRQVFDVPYDWRRPMDEVARDYLKPAINEVKRVTGTSKVIIVVHSLGGLVARSYIQGSLYDTDDPDVDRLFLVGTPSGGALFSSYIISVGKPEIFDETFASGLGDLQNMYYNTVNNLLTVYQLYTTVGSARADRVRYAVRQYVPAAYDTARWKSDAVTIQTQSGTMDPALLGRNSFLDNLNSSSTRDRMTKATDDPSKVRTVFIYGYNLNSFGRLVLDSLTENPVSIDDSVWTTEERYAAGNYVFPESFTNSQAGDGTMCIAPWAMEWDPGANYFVRHIMPDVSHAGLLADKLGGNHDVAHAILVYLGYTVDVIPLTDGKCPVCAAMTKDTPEPSQMQIQTTGSMYPYVSDEAGRSSGVNPTSGDTERAIPSSSVNLSASGGGVSMENPTTGRYVCQLTGMQNENGFSFGVYYNDVARSNNMSRLISGIYHSNTITCAVDLDAEAGTVEIVSPVLPPSSVQAAQRDGYTRLTWAMSLDPDLAGYTVYAKSYDEANYSLLDTVNAGAYAYLTDIPWNVSGAETGRYYFVVLAAKADGSESFFHEAVENTGSARYHAMAAAADYDGDGRTDPAVLRLDSGTISALLSASGYSSMSVTFTNVPGIYPVSGDFDGDGKSDFAVYYRGGIWHAKLSSDGSSASADFGRFNTLPVAADYDGDGKSDPAYYHEESGLWAWMLSGSSYASNSIVIGSNGWTPVVADYDGDGKADPAVYQDATGAWTVMRSSYQYASVSLAGFGGSGYVPVVADYDGDGKADPGIYRTSSGWLTVLLSGSGYQSATAAMSAGALPLIGDFDGDGKTDLATYLEATGQWNVMLSASSYGVAHASFGGPGLVPVQ